MKPRPARWTEPRGQEKKEECGKCQEERTDEGRKGKRRVGQEKTKDPARGPPDPGEKHRQGVESAEPGTLAFHF